MLFKIFLKILDFLPEFPFRCLKAIWITRAREIPFLETDTFIIFCHTYCLDRDKNLTRATKRSLLLAASLCSRYPKSTIVFGCCDFPKGFKEEELFKKIAFLVEGGVPKEKIISIGDVSNTVTEVKKGIEYLEHAEHTSGAKGIMVIAEQICASSQLILWHKYLPKKFKLGFATFVGEFNEDHIYSAQKSERLWLLASVFRYWLFYVFGMRAGFIKESAD